jgi:hypothetical protein
MCGTCTVENLVSTVAGLSSMYTRLKNFLIIIIFLVLHKSLAHSHNSTGLTDQALLISHYTKNFVTIWHVLSVLLLSALHYIQQEGD